MRQYERYVLQHLLWPSVVITASLTALVWQTQMLKFIDFVLGRGLSIADFFYLTGLMLPSLLLVLIPICLTIAVIYTYNRLTVESELIVLGAVGISPRQLARPVWMVGGGAVLMCYALSLFLMPAANGKFRDIRAFFRDQYASVLLEEEVFNNPMPGVTVFVRARDSANNLEGILLEDNRDPKQALTLIADHGRLEQGEHGPRFRLSHGIRQQWREGKVSWLAFDDYSIDFAFYGATNARKPSADELGIRQLFSTEGLSEKQAGAFLAEAHQRLTWPLLALSLPLMALALLLSSEFNRRGQWQRMVASALVTALLLVVYFGARGLAVRLPAMAGGLYLLAVGGVLLGLYVLGGGRLWRKPRVVAMPEGGAP